MEYTYIILDNDNSISLELETLLGQYDDFYCANLSNNPTDALDAILKHRPDVVYIYLNENTSEYFTMIAELYKYVEDIPLIIAVAKTKEYAYDAIKNNFFDYIMCPFNDFDLRKSVFRLKKQALKENTSKTICLKSYQDYRYINTNDILYLKADNNATDFILKDGSSISAFKTLKTFECGLPKNFIRIHQSYILNCNYVSRISLGKSICVLKEKKMEVPFSRSYKENMKIIKEKLTDNAFFALN